MHHTYAHTQDRHTHIERDRQMHPDGGKEKAAQTDRHIHRREEERVGGQKQRVRER